MDVRRPGRGVSSYHWFGVVESVKPGSGPGLEQIEHNRPGVCGRRKLAAEDGGFRIPRSRGLAGTTLRALLSTEPILPRREFPGEAI